MAKNKNKTLIIIALLVTMIIALGIGYAAFSDTLTISGTANASGKFDLQFSTATVESAVGVDEENTTAVISDDKDKLTVHVADLAYPGAGVKFHAVIKNVGNVPAKVESVVPTNITGNDSVIVIKGLDAITTNHPTIEPNGTCSIDFTVEWDKDSDTIAAAGETCDFQLVVNYTQDTAQFSGSTSHTDVNE